MLIQTRPKPTNTDQFTVPVNLAMIKEITLKYSFAYSDEDFKEVVAKFVKGKPVASQHILSTDLFCLGEYAGVEKMVSARANLQDISKKGFDELLANKDEHVKILITSREELVAS